MKKSTFITGTDTSNQITFDPAEDIILIKRWKAHHDLINQITYVPDLKIIATCSFDCNVHMWSRDMNGPDKPIKRVGSLLLGTGRAQTSEQTEAEKRRYANVW